MPDWFLEILGYATIYAIIVKAILASSPTPKTDTTYGKVYRFLEWTTMVIGRVKEQAK